MKSSSRDKTCNVAVQRYKLSPANQIKLKRIREKLFLSVASMSRKYLYIQLAGGSFSSTVIIFEFCTKSTLLSARPE